ncbi:hypothetical protein GGP50_000836 [Salinibacter ruber]|uniref:DUF1788 domain-containing protein n=1 Tax=Salinibacter ruber TaxID=146919 RepID=UPI0021698D75|nr:hypothetical protein [Salinibacter ruber]
MSKIDELLDRYEENVSRPWRKRVDGSQKVWFVVYPPEYEREIRARTGEFEMATARAGHDWTLCDLTTAFPEWMSKHEYRDRYFEEPSGFDFIKEDFLADLADRVQNALVEAGEDEVVALTGIGTLFGFVHVSELISEVEPEIQGRLVVFFPGRHEQNTYRLLDARDGWDYLAMPIKA